MRRIITDSDNEQLAKDIRDLIIKYNIDYKYIGNSLGKNKTTILRWARGLNCCRKNMDLFYAWKKVFEESREGLLPKDDAATKEAVELSPAKVKLKREQEQVILTEAEEIVEALQGNECVFDSDRNIYYRAIDGVICSFSRANNSLIAVNAILLSDNILYVMRDKKIILEIGKFYKTEEGHKIIVLGKGNQQDFACAYVGDNNKIVETDKFGTSLKIISEWKD